MQIQPSLQVKHWKGIGIVLKHWGSSLQEIRRGIRALEEEAKGMIKKIIE